jgi:hypothetical protein
MVGGDIIENNKKAKALLLAQDRVSHQAKAGTGSDHVTYLGLMEW